MFDPEDLASAARGDAAAEALVWLRLHDTLALRPELATGLLAASPDPGTALRESGAPCRLGPAAARRRARELSRLGFSAVPATSPAYPERLRALTDAAPLLLVAGLVESLSRPAVAIVGSRAATVYGLEVARRLAHDLARAGLVIVSGLARGVDAAAHEGALDAEGSTVALLPCGPERIYPPEHRGLASRIRERGAVVTELPPGSPPLKQFFPLRNRLIAALARVVVVVEGRTRSGSLLTARLAAGRSDVMAVPGPIDAPTSAGPNRLIRDGARPVLGAADVLEELCWATAPTASPAAPSPPSDRAGAGEEAPGSELIEALAGAPASRDELARRLGRPVGALAAELVGLVLDGRVAEDRDGRFRLLGG